MSANDKQFGGDHYKTGGEQHWDFTWRNEYNQFEYCMSKYVLRCFKKNGIEDLKKAKHHGEKYLEVGAKSIEARPLKDLDMFLLGQDVSLSQKTILSFIHLGLIKQAVNALTDMIEGLECDYNPNQDR